ncbi:MAG: branched-chain amino acid ABC transporter permease [Thermodesulfobacteriota bacterium]
MKNLLFNWRDPKIYFPLILLIFLLILPIFLPTYFLHIMVTIFVFAFLSVAWNIIGGYAGQLSLGNAAFFGLGAYGAVLFTHYFNIPPWVGGVIIGGAAALFLSLLMGWVCFRLRGPYFAISSLAIGEVMRLLFLHQRKITFGAEGVTVPFKGDSLLYFQFSSKVPYYYIALVMVLLGIYICWKIERSRLGYYLIAINQNQDAAEAVGINSVRTKQIALSLSALLTAIGGVFYAQYIFFIDPDFVFSLGLSIEFALMAIVGGVGSVFGPVIGAFLLRPAMEITNALLGATYMGVHLIVYGGLLITVVLLKPEGLIGWLGRRYETLLKFLPGLKEKE